MKTKELFGIAGCFLFIILGINGLMKYWDEPSLSFEKIVFSANILFFTGLLLYFIFKKTKASKNQEPMT